MADSFATLLRPEQGPVLPSFERLAPSPPLNLVAAEVESRTRPGDVVLDLFGRGGWIARTAIGRQRRAITCETSALGRLLAEVVLRPPDLRHFDAAVASLAFSPRGEGSLRQSLNDLFSSRCATCNRSTIVDEFLWDTEAVAPFRKVYRCLTCRDQLGGGETRTATTNATDAAMSIGGEPGEPARRAMLSRFAVVPGIEHLPDELLALYTPRTLTAIHAVLHHLDADLRAAPIEAALRLALLHVLLPASRLNGYPGRVTALRVANGHVRPPGSRQWRERNPWLLFEEGCRAVRDFMQQLDGTPGAPVQARVGDDPRDLVDATANVVVRYESALPGRAGAAPERPGRQDATGPHEPLARLAICQPPLRWSSETVAFAYLATSLLLGHERSATLPLRALVSQPTGSEWSWRAATVEHTLAAAEPLLSSDARVVVLLDSSAAEGLVATVLGGVRAGYRLATALIAEPGEPGGGTVELVTPESVEDLPAPVPPHENTRDVVAALRGPTRGFSRTSRFRRGTPPHRDEPVWPIDAAERPFRLRGMIDDRDVPAADADGNGDRADTDVADRSAGASRQLDEELDAVRRQVSEIAVEILQARGEPADFGRMLGDILVGLDRSGHLRRLVGTRSRPVPGGGAEADDAEPESAGAIRATSEVGAADAAMSAPESDHVATLLDIIRGELTRPDHPGLREIEPGRWWLRDRHDLELAGLPLSDRIEWAAFSLLSATGGMNESAFFDRIGAMFRGYDAPDPALVRACLESYRSASSTPEFVRTSDELQSRYREHTELIGLLVEYGHRLGLRCWVNAHEQKRVYRGRHLSALLSDLEQRAYLPLISRAAGDSLEAVDCIWYLRGKATFVFEVEWTAMLTEPVLRRGPLIPQDDTTVRFLVILPERVDLVRFKLARSPVLRRALEVGNWHILKANHLRALVEAEPASLERLAPYLGLDPEIEQRGEQMPLFIASGPDDEGSPA
jgi:hypothetical protein